MPPVQFDAVACAGGLDQVTPTLALKNGYARRCINFECGVAGGYARVAGYERFDGQASPSGNAYGQVIQVSSGGEAVAVGDNVSSSSGGTGVVATIDGLVIGITKITGTFSDGDTVTCSAGTVGTIVDNQAGPTTPKEGAIFRAACADIHRGLIDTVPGSGAIRGIVMLNDVLYAFRDNSGGTALGVYKSSASGWTAVPFLKRVAFTAGGTSIPDDGSSLVQSSVTATIKRVVRTSGSWSAGSAAGYLIITTPATGSFASGAATADGVNVTLSGAATTISMLPGGAVECIVTNFYGQANTTRVYGVDGVNPAFEFDGETLVPIVTGATTDTPTHLVNHLEYLFLSFGSSIIPSAAGDPFDWTGTSGTFEIATGSAVTGLVTLPGSADSGALGVFSRSSTYILYGKGVDTFALVSYEEGVGAMPFSAKNMSQTMAYDDSGALAIQAAIQYGNFAQTTLTATLVPFVNDRRDKCTCASVNRNKSQYRVFFSDGYGLYITIVNGKFVGATPVYFPVPVRCVFDGKTSTGEHVTFFGADNGYVYQLERGSSFDDEPIEWLVAFNYTNARGPRVKKRWRKASIELSTSGAAQSAYVETTIGYSSGYDSIEYAQSDYVSGEKYIGNNRWDSFSWDNFFWDGSGTSPLDVELLGTSENIALSFSGSSKYVNQFSINSIIFHYTPRRAMR